MPTRPSTANDVSAFLRIVLVGEAGSLGLLQIGRADIGHALAQDGLRLHSAGRPGLTAVLAPGRPALAANDLRTIAVEVRVDRRERIDGALEPEVLVAVGRVCLAQPEPQGPPHRGLPGHGVLLLLGIRREREVAERLLARDEPDDLRVGNPRCGRSIGGGGLGKQPVLVALLIEGTRQLEQPPGELRARDDKSLAVPLAETIDLALGEDGAVEVRRLQYGEALAPGTLVQSAGENGWQQWLGDLDPGHFYRSSCNGADCIAECRDADASYAVARGSDESWPKRRGRRIRRPRCREVCPSMPRR